MLSPFFQSTTLGTNPDAIGTIRVLIVGNKGTCNSQLFRFKCQPINLLAGSGKSSLAQLIADGSPATNPRPTAGCSVHLKLFIYPAERAAQHPAGPHSGQEFSIELWDVSGAPRYEAVRSMYYSGINGVLLVHDLSSTSHAHNPLASLRRWAMEVASKGRGWQSPLPEERAVMSLGGLPVPCLVIGNKADLIPSYRKRHQLNFLDRAYVSFKNGLQAILNSSASFLPVLYKQRGHLRSTPLKHKASGGMPRLDSSEALLHGNLQASALHGDLDVRAMSDFFCELIDRQYFPGVPRVSSALDERLPTVMFNSIAEMYEEGSSGPPSAQQTPEPSAGERSTFNFSPLGVEFRGGMGRIDDLL